MAQFDLQSIRDIADEGIARYGLRGYAHKLGLDVSTMRSLRDGRDMQISKLIQIVGAMNMSLTMMPARSPGSARRKPGGAAPEMVRIPYHPMALPNGMAEASPLALQADWIKGMGWRASDLRCVIAPSAGVASTQSCIAGGALCLIDCGTTWPADHALWACLEDGALTLAHVGRPEPGMLLFAGAEAGEAPRIMTGAALDLVMPLGRVVWAGAPVDTRVPALDLA